jgi:hypothetical protein
LAGELILFSTDHCTLCDEALELLLSMPELAGHSVRVIDIAEDPALVDRYAELIPVLQIQGMADESAVRLCWPFDSAAILEALG